jgi:hypothetical protein
MQRSARGVVVQCSSPVVFQRRSTMAKKVKKAKAPAKKAATKAKKAPKKAKKRAKK